MSACREDKKKMGLWLRKEITDAVACLAIKNKRTQTAEVEIALKMSIKNERSQVTIEFLRRSLYDLIEKEESDQRGVVHWIKSRFGITTSSQWAKNTLAMADDIANGTEPKCEEVARAFKKS